MWTEFLKPFQNRFPILPYHIVLLYGNVKDLFYEDVRFGEEWVHEALLRHASSCFDKFWTADPLSPLTQVFPVHAIGGSENKGENTPLLNQQMVDDREFVSSAERPDLFETLYQIEGAMETSESRNMIIFDYIEKLLPDQLRSEEDESYHLRLLKWTHNRSIHVSKNLLILICRNWNGLCAEVKQMNIKHIEIPSPDLATYESYLRYIINYLQEVDYAGSNHE
ncbi:hypothetical protein BVY01_00760 [bacterium I07]|nr:hypothetical protein BVY01_00760 [bacterium I07]